MTAELRLALRNLAAALPPGATILVQASDLLALLQPTAVTPPEAVPPRAEPPTVERYMTPEEVAALLKVPRAYPYRHQRQLGGVKVGKYLRFPESAICRRLGRSR
ncbi:MAG: helix-turn-helix domain-containing protein [Thermoanaerobaculales bacterium]